MAEPSSTRSVCPARYPRMLTASKLYSSAAQIMSMPARSRSLARLAASRGSPVYRTAVESFMETHYHFTARRVLVSAICQGGGVSTTTAIADRARDLLVALAGPDARLR